ncbi:4-hydroxybenzoate 3-monooxygenase [Saccharomonospora azurea]|uniref:2-polyprenyl-6-methoxyphenol hydroxylase-like oxidoreductase n=1 Tax=Saccharomonospora azurea NA-128 TaxID=882081 RepID=H8G454_9PSEU|nr:4-hydroxybenzoate 3-monooxygenase [Saccharomonospora azurea]EHK87679.1 4-hydroxybenzoate 3-monooxygenase [Saccharomonospora azurea SZMC 14600]EHY91152.1 2-polyprenyl-6-methoxyphenol hydroxylase-like oxidoreductase [Saccharomonospora azurea NA-128]
MDVTTTQVGIVGGGPAGLMLSHLLALRGIDSVVVDHRSRLDIERTVRAGILEADSVRLLTETGVSERVLSEGDQHHGIYLAFGGESHHVDFRELVGASVCLYPQTEVFIDLANAREAAGADVRFGVSDTTVHDITGTSPSIRYTDPDGTPREVRCRYLVGADGSHSMCRHQIPAQHIRQYRKEYPFAWFGILCEAPKSAPELIYSHSERGFALISQRTETMQRMYFQCDPDENVDDWSDDRIWSELRARVEPNGHELVEGPVTDKAVLRFRSNVVEPMRYGSLLLAGDAAHTVPPTGAKGLNLALADVRILADVLQKALAEGDDDVLDEYSQRALDRVWRSQHFSYWMTSMLHRLPDTDAFSLRRQVAELRSVVRSKAGSTFLAEGYTGWPST